MKNNFNKGDNFRINLNKAKESAKSCLHDSCESCKGTGKKATGGMCVHNISCRCSKCLPTYL